jgi:23S rRNA (pseudouridine1915-N3)-methyltransferase
VRLFVVAAGKLKDKNLRQIADDYLGRIQRYARCEEIETRDATGLARAVPEGSIVVALEVFGTALSSDSFARKVEQWSQIGKGRIAFLIGGADGLPPELSRPAEFRLSLSSLTLPHRLARIILLEQLYRAMTILRGEPYARES